MTAMSWKNFQRLMFAARGGKVLTSPVSLSDIDNQRRRVLLRVFPLKAKHVRLDAITSFGPQDFHQQLCQCIRSATKRVHLASLYVGPGADPVESPHEVELLDALRATSCPNVRILLDRNRALRPVPLSVESSSFKKTTTTTSRFITSAEACHQALMSRRKSYHHSNLYLLSILPDWLQAALPNPWNEIAGVFHLKVYIVDDDVIVSGANLSQEYFENRMDRYLWIQHGGNGLVECLAELLHVLMQYAVPYQTIMPTAPPTTTSLSSSQQKPQHHRRITAQQLLESITRILTTTEEVKYDVELQQPHDPDIVAYAIPSFQAPAHFFNNHSTVSFSQHQQQQQLPMDEQVLEDLLLEAAFQQKQQHVCYTVRLASAYLNPTLALQDILQHYPQIYFLTAGRISHGFKPKKKKTRTSQTASATGNNRSKKTEWIPTIFDVLARQTASRLLAAGNKNCRCHAQLFFYQRPEWTFHAKGLWLSQRQTEVPHDSNDNPVDRQRETDDSSSLAASSPLLDNKSSSASLLAVTHGSSNYGARSAVRDMESNILLLFPPSNKPSQLQQAFCDEWNQFCEYASTDEPKQKLPWPMQMALPWIRSFF